MNCGKVYEQLRKNPNLDLKQVAKVTRLSLEQVSDITKYLQHENLVPKAPEKVEEIDAGRERIVEIFAPSQARSSSSFTEAADKNNDPEIETRSKEQKENNGIVCLSCQSSLPQGYYDDHNGLCPSCYYKTLLIESAKQERRSGIYGSDRAGTW